ncbi:DUF2628 domain-containing protein [Paraburkholderia kururiensis]|uniref:DUF2628 domain-containing protein n=1 Tax=Paraburkholderia kururiensis TaxID=984307 RepID=UPI0039A4DBDA
MAFCEQCGAQLGADAAFCNGCGNPATGLATPSDALPGLSAKWRQRFAAIERAGGEGARWWRWPNAKELTRRDKRLITSNLWAFVFGPFYYLYLGMWRKAITLTLLALVIDAILGMAGDVLNVPVDGFLWIVSAVMFRQCANVDYYRKAMLKRREWW